VLKHLIKKYAPKSVEVLSAISDDQVVSNENGDAAYRDNMPDDQPKPEVSATAKEKAKKVKEKVAEMKARQAAASEVQEPDEQEPEADQETGEIFNQEEQ
jgi:recombinational DNA repair protein RecT